MLDLGYFYFESMGLFYSEWFNKVSHFRQQSYYSQSINFGFSSQTFPSQYHVKLHILFSLHLNKTIFAGCFERMLTSFRYKKHLAV